MAFSGPVPPGFRDPDTKQMVDVETSCEIFRKLLGFPKEYVVSTSGSPNKVCAINWITAFARVYSGLLGFLVWERCLHA